MSHKHLRTQSPSANLRTAVHSALFRRTSPARHAAPHRSHRLRVVSAAAVGVASIFAVSVSQSVHASSLGQTSNASVLDLSAGAMLGKQSTTTQNAGRASAKASTPAAAASTAPVTPPAPPPPALKVLDYQFQLQTTFYDCGPAATRIAATARGQQPSQDDLAGAMGTTVNGTNSAIEVTRALNGLTGTSFYHTTSIPGSEATPAQMDQMQADIVHAVSNGYAVVVNIVGTGWDTNGVPHSYDGGHYLTVVGYQDEGRIAKIADPANPVGDGTYWMSTINLANWAGTRGYAS